MRLYKRKDSPNWYVQYGQDGERTQKALHKFLGLKLPVPIRDKRTAEDLLADFRMKEIRDHMGIPLPSDSVRVVDFYTEYLRFCDQNWTLETARSQTHRAHRWLAFLNHKGITFVSQITKKLVNEFVDTYNGNIKNSTKNRYINLVHGSLKWAVEQGYLKENLVHGIVRRKEIQTDWLMDFKEDEITKLFSIEDKAFALYLKVMFYTFMRRKEVLSLRWDDLDFNKRLIRIRMPKSQRPEIIPMADSVIPILKSIPQNGEKLFDFSPDYVTKKFHRLVKRLGLKNTKRLHDVRHLGLSLLAHKGVDLKTLQKLARHKDVKTTMRYIHTSTESERRAVNLL